LKLLHSSLLYFELLFGNFVLQNTAGLAYATATDFSEQAQQEERNMGRTGRTCFAFCNSSCILAATTNGVSDTWPSSSA
jgi:hypothetical protein